MLTFRQITNVSVFSLVVGFMLPANAIPNFNSIEVSTLNGSNDTTNAQTFTSTGQSNNEADFTDDVFLESLTFGNGTNNVTISGDEKFAAVKRITVVSGREGNGSDANVNGESGFDDDNSDGDPDNFAKVGLDIDTDRESTDPLTQDLGLFSALNNRSLSEIADGEGAKEYELKFTFTQGIVDNSDGNDQAPELVIFERGINDGDIEIELITGGTFDSPTIFNGKFTEESNNYTDTGINIRTSEIDNPQDLGIIGLDFSEDFGLTDAENTPVYGLILRSTDGGADINGALLSAQDTSQFRDLPDGLNSSQPVPFEVEGTMGLLVLGGYLWYRKHKKNRRFQNSEH